MKRLWCLMVAAAPVAAQTDPADAWVPSLTNLMGRPASELRDVVARYSSDRRALGRRYDLEASAVRRSAMARFDRAWLKQNHGHRVRPARTRWAHRSPVAPESPHP